MNSFRISTMCQLIEVVCHSTQLADEVSGFIDFYYACNGNFMYDLAIAVNDWARTADNKLDELHALCHSNESNIG